MSLAFQDIPTSAASYTSPSFYDRLSLTHGRIPGTRQQWMISHPIQELSVIEDQGRNKADMGENEDVPDSAAGDAPLA